MRNLFKSRSQLFIMLKVVRDYFEEVESVRTAYLELRERNPNHIYIRFATFDEEGTVTVNPDFLKTFEPKDWPRGVDKGLLYRIRTLVNVKEALQETTRRVA
mgnify:CR=1 FL=1